MTPEQEADVASLLNDEPVEGNILPQEPVKKKATPIFKELSNDLFD